MEHWLSFKMKLDLYGIAPQAPWSVPRIGALCPRRSYTPHSKASASFFS